jgi:5-methylcytosine-specific restriction enzyme subunit McrC
LELADDVREALERTGLVSTRWAGNGVWTLLPCGKVGAVQVGELLVEVKPKEKVGISQILFLLSYANDPGFRPENVEAVQSTDLWAALGETLARLCEQATMRGVLQGYVSQDEALRTLRGRIRLSDQVTRRPGTNYPVEATHDEFTVDIPENQILRSAVRRMLTIPRLEPGIRRRLAHVDRTLMDVSVLSRGSGIPSWTPSRLNAAYVPAMRIAQIILRNTVAEAGVGKVHVASFIVDMAKVFEDFVTTALTEALQTHPGRTRPQYRTYLDERQPNAPCRRLLMKPDVVYEVDGQPALIFDAKYKSALNSGQYPNVDHYQMLAYATALGPRDAWLIYAGSGHLVSRQVRNSSIRTHEFPLDLSATPAQVLAKIRLVADLAITSALL